MEAEKMENTTSANKEAMNYRGVKAMPFIIGNETFEKLGSTGIQSNLMVYLTTVFNMKNINAVLLINIFQGTSNLTPFLGAFLSDSYFGRYNILVFASFCTLLGMTGLTLIAAIPKLHPPKCEVKKSGSCVGATGWQLAFLLSGFGLQILGAGGIRPCNLAFGADQFNPATESGKKGILSFFNWYYFTFTFAMMISATFIVYIQTNISWSIGLAIPACLMLLACVLFLLGSKNYIKVAPQGSPLTSVAQVLAAAAKKRRLALPEDPALSLFNYIPPNSINSKLYYTDQFRWLGKSAIVTSQDEINSNGSAVNQWRLCSIQQVEEAKCVLRVIPIWASAIIFCVAMNQQNTFVVLQALQSDRRLSNRGFQVPAGSFVVFTMLSITISIPIYDRIVIPSLRKLIGNHHGITLLQRMGIGIILSIITMIVSGLVEEKRRHLVVTKLTLGVTPKGGAISSMSALWLIPQLTLTGVTEAFNIIGQIEFYYKQFPENMRSIGGAFLFLGFACSSYLSGFLLSIVHHITARSKSGDWLPEDLNQGKLDWFYYLVAGSGVVNFAYLVFAKWYRYKDSNAELSREQGNNSDKVFV